MTCSSYFAILDIACSAICDSCTWANCDDELMMLKQYIVLP